MKVEQSEAAEKVVQSWERGLELEPVGDERAMERGQQPNGKVDDQTPNESWDQTYAQARLGRFLVVAGGTAERDIRTAGIKRKQ